MNKKDLYPIKVNNLDWSYGDKSTLQGINISVKKGGLYSIIGPNGSGKTTLLKNISRTLETSKEKVFINGLDIAGLKNSELAKMISYVPQSIHMDFEFTVMDIVLMGRNPYLKRFQSETELDFEIAKKSMQITNTWELREKLFNEISGGEKQRAIIARAIAQDNDIMLLDEPVSQLDIQHQIELMNTLEYLANQKQYTIVTVLHDLNLAAQYSDYIFLLDNGKAIAEGSPESVITKDNIKKVYKINVNIINDPQTGKPHVIPIKTNNII